MIEMEYWAIQYDKNNFNIAFNILCQDGDISIGQSCFYITLDYDYSNIFRKERGNSIKSNSIEVALCRAIFSPFSTWYKYSMTE